MATEKRWKKVLYEDQNVPDNHVDESFLNDLRKNLSHSSYDYWTTVRQSGSVTQQVSSVCIFVMVFIYMKEKVLSPETVFYSSVVLTALCYCVFCSFPQGYSTRTKWDGVKTGVMFACFNFGLSPVVVSLTETISTDTIYAMTTVMLLANIIFYDYCPDDEEVTGVKGTLSLNAATFASVCLASRLNTTWHAFSIVTFSFEWFALWPLFTQSLKKVYPGSQEVLTIFLGVLAGILLLTWTPIGAVIFLLLHLFINFYCPYWLVQLLPLKNNIHGPWDEAEIKK